MESRDNFSQPLTSCCAAFSPTCGQLHVCCEKHQYLLCRQKKQLLQALGIETSIARKRRLVYCACFASSCKKSNCFLLGRSLFLVCCTFSLNILFYSVSSRYGFIALLCIGTNRKMCTRPPWIPGAKTNCFCPEKAIWESGPPYASAVGAQSLLTFWPIHFMRWGHKAVCKEAFATNNHRFCVRGQQQSACWSWSLVGGLGEAEGMGLRTHSSVKREMRHLGLTAHRSSRSHPLLLFAALPHSKQ